jgi:hypothetical protein
MTSDRQKRIHLPNLTEEREENEKNIYFLDFSVFGDPIIG